MDETQPKPNDAVDEKTELPGLPTWRSVYLLVVVVFLVYVVLLITLAKVFA